MTRPTSAVTNSFRRQALSDLSRSIDSANSTETGEKFYIGLSRSSSLNPLVSDDNISSLLFQSSFEDNLQSVKILGANSFVVPRINWSDGQTYDEYDNNGENQFYVLNSANDVFVCVKQGKESYDGAPKPSTVEPTRAGAVNGLSKTFRTADGYLWRQVAILSNLAVANFQTSDWMPIKTVFGTGAFLPISQDSDQLNLLQNESVSGEIINLAIDQPGTGYTSIPTLSITGNGNSASFTCDVFNGEISNIIIDSDGNGEITGHGSGYDYAAVSISGGGGSGASIRAVISPGEGLNADPVSSLKGKDLMLQTDVVGNESGTIRDNAQFNQIGIIKGIKEYASSDFFVSNTGNALKALQLSSVVQPANWTNSVNLSFIDIANSSKVGKIYYYDDQNNKLYYYQDVETGYDDFAALSSIQLENDATTSATIDSLIDPDFKAHSGEVLYINNLGDPDFDYTTGVLRSSDQTEDIRIIIQL